MISEGIEGVYRVMECQVRGYFIWNVFQLILSRLFESKGLSEAKICEDIEDEELGPSSDVSGF